jgi:lipopolysaccharide export system permease protein
MRIFDRWGLRAVIPVFIGACLFFALFIELIDLFNDIPRYLQMKQSISSVLFIELLYLPKCLSFGFPIAMVFAISLTLGNFYSNNELIAVFSSGVSLFRFCMPLLGFALLVSGISFAFNEFVVIDTLKKKTELRNQALGFADQSTNPNVVVFDHGTSVVYRVALYNNQDKSLDDVMVVCRDGEGQVTRIVKAPSARWNLGTKAWTLSNAVIYHFTLPKAAAGTGVTALAPEYRKEFVAQLQDPDFNKEPNAFRRMSQNVEELKVGDAREWVDTLRKSGLPFRASETKLLERYSFACTPFIVAFIACSIGSRFKKNILLMSLLVSLMLSVIYYVIQMVSGLMASLQLMPSLMGAWLGVSLYFVAGTVLFRRARS